MDLSRPQSDTSRSVDSLWTGDRPLAETSTWQHTTNKRHGHPFHPGGIQPVIPASERPQTDAFDRVATGIDSSKFTSLPFWELENLKHPISVAQNAHFYHNARRHTSDVSNLHKPRSSQHFRLSEAGAVYRSNNDVCPVAHEVSFLSLWTARGSRLQS